MESAEPAKQLAVTVLRNEKLVAEAGDISVTQRKGNALSWKPLSNNGQRGLRRLYVCYTYIVLRISVRLP
jgi:hypothetical protein